MPRSIRKPLAAFRPKLVALEDRTNPVAAFALGNDALIAFDTDFPQFAGKPVPVTGLAAGESLVGIDFRPQNGQLYGLASNGAGAVRLYAISERTGVATPLSAAPVQFDDGAGGAVAITGTNFGFDFNPTVDRIRVVTGTGLNFRMNPNNGTLVDGNPNTPGTNPDGSLNGGGTGGSGTAYTNSSPNVSTTTQYTLDAATDKLFVQSPPNNGTLTNGVPLTLNGGPLNVSGVNGFDIPPAVTGATGSGFAALTAGGRSGLYGVDLATGQTTFFGPISAAPPGGVRGLAVQSRSLPAAGVPMIALTADGASLLRFNSATPAATTKVAITEVAAGETLVGIDFRPATGQLFALGVNDGANTGTLYVLDPQLGKATVVGTAAGSISFTAAAGGPVGLPAASAGYGFDFNPTVDRVRVVTGTGLNLRLNPVTGGAVDGNPAAAGTNPDGNLNGGAAAGTGTAYTNSFAQATGKGVTTQYTLDAATDKLFVQSPPNNGTLTNGVPLTLGGQPLDITEVNGFEIPTGVTVSKSNAPAAGTGFAVLTVGGASGLYSIDLASGAATSLGAVGAGDVALGGLTAANFDPSPATGPGGPGGGPPGGPGGPSGGPGFPFGGPRGRAAGRMNPADAALAGPAPGGRSDFAPAEGTNDTADGTGFRPTAPSPETGSDTPRSEPTAAADDRRVRGGTTPAAGTDFDAFDGVFVG